MAKSKIDPASRIEPKDYESSLVAARKAGSDKGQSHWWHRLMVVIKRRAKAAGKPER